MESHITVSSTSLSVLEKEFLQQEVKGQTEPEGTDKLAQADGEEGREVGEAEGFARCTQADDKGHDQCV